MAQYDIYQFLKKNKGKKFTRNELMQELDIKVATIDNNLSRLIKFNSIHFGTVPFKGLSTKRVY